MNALRFLGELPKETKRWAFVGIMSLLIVLALFIGQCQAGTVSLAWDPNSETDLAGYKIHYGNTSKVYDKHIDVGNVTEFTVPNLVDGTWYFAATAYNTSGLESDYSNEVFTVLSSTGPGSPKNARITRATVIWNGKEVVVFPKKTP